MRLHDLFPLAVILSCCFLFTSCEKSTSAAERQNSPQPPPATGPAADVWRGLRAGSTEVLDAAQKEIEALKSSTSEAARNAHEELSRRLSAARNRAGELVRQGGAAAEDAWQTLQREIETLRADVRKATGND